MTSEHADSLNWPPEEVRARRVRLAAAALLAAGVLFAAWTVWLIWLTSQRLARWEAAETARAAIAQAHQAVLRLATSQPGEARQAAWMGSLRLVECAAAAALPEVERDCNEALGLLRQMQMMEHRAQPTLGAAPGPEVAVFQEDRFRAVILRLETAYHTADRITLQSAEELRSAWRAAELQMLGAAFFGLCGLLLAALRWGARPRVERPEEGQTAAAIFECCRDGLLVLDSKGVVVDANPAAGRMFGCTPEDLKGAQASNLIRGGDRRQRRGAAAPFAQPPVSDLITWRPLRAVARDGTEFPVDVVTSEFHTETETRTVLSIRDVTVRRKAEESMIRELDFFRSVLGLAETPIAVFDRDGKPLYFNLSCEQLLGYSWQELRDQPFWESLCPQEQRKSAQEAFDAALRGKGPNQFAVHSAGRQGLVRQLDFRLAITQDSLAQPAYAVAAVREAGGAAAPDAQSAHAEKMEALGRLASGVAHDFNNLITAISGYSDLVLENMAPDDPNRTDVEEISRAAARAAALTRQLMDFSRRQPSNLQLCDLNRIATGTIKMLERLVGETHPIVTVLDRNLWPVMADPSQLERIIVNLALNARDAMPSGGSIIFRTANRVQPPPAGESVMLEVQDSGVGIPASVLPRIFEPFFTTKPGGKGTGLGLATVYAIVRSLGGKVDVESAPGKGSTFRVYFPKAHAVPAGLEDSTDVAGGVPIEAPVGGAEAVLVVEDEEEVRSLICRLLRRNGYQVYEASSPEEALAHTTPVKLLICDVVLPGERGPALAARLAAAQPGLKILYISGYPEGELPAPDLASAQLLLKPFAPEELLNRVRHLLDAPLAEPAASAD